MIIDAEINSGEMLNFLLKKEGFETEFAHTSEQFYKKINDFKPEMIILSDTKLNIVEMIQDNYVRNMDMPKCILITKNRFSEREQKILFKKFNIVDFINPDNIIDELTTNIQKYL